MKTKTERRKEDLTQKHLQLIHTAITAPGIRQISSRQSYAPTTGNLRTSAGYAAIAAALTAAIAYSLAELLQLPPAYPAIGAGAVTGLIAFLAHQQTITKDNQLTWSATFDELRNPQPAPAFIPAANQPQTLVKDSPLRQLATHFAQQLPAAGYNITYRLWVDRKRSFTRTQFDALRAILDELEYTTNHRLNDAGIEAVTAWAIENYTDQELHLFRNPPHSAG